jgi:hypothetical protein
MSVTSQLKSVSMPKFDDVLAYSGLQRTPSAFSKVLAGAGLLSLGALVGAGLTFWLSSPKNRKAVSSAIGHGIDKVSETIAEGMPVTAASGNGIAKAHDKVVVR